MHNKKLREIVLVADTISFKVKYIRKHQEKQTIQVRRITNQKDKMIMKYMYKHIESNSWQGSGEKHNLILFVVWHPFSETQIEEAIDNINNNGN